MKKHLESQNDIYNNPNLSIEDIARRKIKEKMDKEKGAANKGSIVDDVDPYATLSDIESTIDLLKSRLIKLEQSEKTEGIDLTELKNRVKNDLGKAQVKKSVLQSKK
jgi:hypothetical protein